ncbi:Secreted effector protein pipB2 [Enhygromyxa salina]|uniref:Secreted effector protein pipB2 n=1 Tax=Enhygromyxa salina TaxID=215803 RepID=A0A2S9XF83_9BACT|nr:DUF2169 domain-containing protein [Enhygromyxa salina]PRP91528.1 Secreted effector protein pipB2 [Enhygromyxa salina]
MKIIKPNRVSALTRCFEHVGVGYLGISALCFLPFSDGDVDLLSEISLWKFVAERLEGVSLDDAVPKARGEYLVNGSLFPPPGATSVVAEAAVGGLVKSIRATGERAWLNSRRKTEPRPLEVMPLDWSRTYGGPDFPHNPLGMGRKEVEFDGVRAVPLPQLEPVDQRLARRDEVGAPIGLGPIDLSWPTRQRLAGTYDEQWLREHSPGPARDLDWSFFNTASRDQQREGAWLPGDAYGFRHMHPSEATVGGRLPPVVARAFISRRDRAPSAAENFERARAAAAPGLDDELAWAMQTDGTTFEEVVLAATTLWFFPDAKRLVLVFTGSTRILTDDGSDVVHLLIAAERSGHPRTLEHYEEVLAERLHPKRGAIAALRDQDLLPEGVSPTLDEVAEDEALFANEGLLAQALFRRAELEHRAIITALEAEGIPESMFPEPPRPPAPPPSIEELPALAEEMLAEAKVQEAEARTQVEAMRAEAEQRLRDEDIDPSFLSQDVGGPPTWTAQAVRDELQMAVDACEAEGADASAFEGMLADEKLQAQWDEQEAQLLAMYRLGAHLQRPAARLPEDAANELRARVERAIANGEPLRELELTGADLRGLELCRADLRGALLESAVLDGVDLSGADLSDAVLAHASLRGTVLDRCTLTNTNLGKADLQGASMRGTKLAKTVLFGADLEGASLAGATVDDVLLIETKLQKVDATGLRAPGLTLLDADISGSDFAGADLSGATLVRIDLSSLDLSGAALVETNFVHCKLDDARLDDADLSGARFVHACSLDRVGLTRAKASRANLRGSSMREAKLSGADLSAADLSECVLVGANFEHARAREAQLAKADLTGARLANADFLGASFLGAELDAAELADANLFGADLARARIDEHTNTGGTNLTRARVYPRARLDDGSVA